MCHPYLAMAATVASAGYSLNEQRKNANRQERFLSQARAEQDRQINQAAGTRLQNRAQQARAERARLRALSAETGLIGTTMSTLLRDVDFQAGRDMSLIELNRENQLRESAMSQQSNLNRVRQPDYLGTALNAGLQVYGIGQSAGMWGNQG